MKVYELMEKLQYMPQDAIVVVRGYESGIDKALEVTTCKINKKRNSKFWEGSHVVSDNGMTAAVYIKSDCKQSFDEYGIGT